MELNLRLKNVSYFETTLPLDPEIQRSFQHWLPEKLRSVSAQRQQEFLAGRFCAVKAAEKIGLSLLSLPQGTTREPVWPELLTGSITHTKNKAFGCISLRWHLKSIGMDAEEVISTDLFRDIASIISNESERKLLTSMTDQHKQSITRTLIFSAKEALYKALFPLCKTYIDFLDASLLSVNFIERSFTIRLNSKNSFLKSYSNEYQGYFSLVDGTLLTVIPISYS